MIEQGLERSIYPTDKPKARVLLAHGAGAGNRHEFMETFSQSLANKGIEVISFNFPYMQTVYELDKKRPPNSNKQLVAHFEQEIELTAADMPLFIAGKSMGGRIATQIAADSTQRKVNGCFVLGYPFIPPGKPEKLNDRIAHFADIDKPTLILQGERDTFGGTALLETISLPSRLQLTWVKSGDHSFKPLKSSGLNQEQNIEFAVQQAYEFIVGQL